MKKLLLLCSVLMLVLTSLPVLAAPLKVFVSKVSAPGAPNREELQLSMQTLLASRLNGENLVTVSSSAEADVIISGSYIAFGKIFSLDAVATTAGGKLITRAYVQGEGQDEMIPVMGKLAEKLSAAIIQSQPAITAPVAALKPGTPEIVPLSAAPTVAAPPGGDIIKLKDTSAAISGSWRSPPIEGVFNLVAVGGKRADGSRDLFLADDRRLLYYRQGEELKQVAVRELKLHEKILALEVLATGQDSADVYLTVMSNEQLVSQVIEVKGDILKPVAENQPYFFRLMALPGAGKRLYVQKTANDRVFSSEVFEAERNGGNIVLKNPLNLPKFTSIYAFAKFADSKGKLFTAVITADNYLVAYNQEQQEIWRSSEKYGGSELFLEKSTPENQAVAAEDKPKVNINQRILLTPAGDLLVCKNDAFWLLGNMRNYSKGTVYGFRWNGESLEAKWQTRSSQYYVPDYAFDGSQKELLLLEIVNKAYILSKGASAISIKKVE